jgi:UDP-glucose 4-epimerase
VYILDSLTNSSKKSLEQIKLIFSKRSIDISNKLFFFKGDLRNKEIIDYVFEKVKSKGNSIDGVIHLAGLKSIKESLNYPFKYWENNVNGSFNLLKSMLENNCKTIVFSSSATVYGNPKDELVEESANCEPIHPYGSTKLTIENLLKNIYQTQTDKWNIAILRYFNPIGAHNSGLIGENSLDIPSNIFPLIINSAYKKNKLKVFGSDWPTNDGTCIRDYIHVSDLADGHVKALDFIFKNNNQLINLNIGTGKGHSVLDLIKTFEKVNNVEVPFIFSSRRDGDYCKLVANNLKAKQILNWIPLKSLEEMCLDGWRWKLMNPNGYF